MTAREMSDLGRVRMREAERRRGGEFTCDDGTATVQLQGEPGWITLTERRDSDRRVNHLLATTINTIVETHRAPLVRCIRELGAEIDRLHMIVRDQSHLLDQAEPHVCGVTDKARHQ